MDGDDMSDPILTKRAHAFGWIVQVVSDQRRGVEAFYSLPEQEAQAIASAWDAWRNHG
jgi:hypothetical protein